MEHRWGERFSVDVAVRLATRPFAMRTGRLVDLSLSGGCIQAPFDLRRLTRVQVAFMLPQTLAHATPVVSAYVARRTDDRIGLEWCEFGPQAVIDLLRSTGHRREQQQSRDHGSDGAPAMPAALAMSVRRG